MRGAGLMVIDELLSQNLLGDWIDQGGPVGIACLPV